MTSAPYLELQIIPNIILISLPFLTPHLVKLMKLQINASHLNPAEKRNSHF